MGSAFYPVFSGFEHEWPDDLDGKALAGAADLLDKVAKNANVPTLFEFYSMSKEDMICELLNGDPDDPSSYEETDLPEEKWFEPAEGLRTLEVLIDYLTTSPQETNRSSDVLQDLVAFRRHLIHAEKRGLLWHLAIDY